MAFGNLWVLRDHLIGGLLGILQTILSEMGEADIGLGRDIPRPDLKHLLTERDDSGVVGAGYISCSQNSVHAGL